jgi:hypothetical protein
VASAGCGVGFGRTRTCPVQKNLCQPQAAYTVEAEHCRQLWGGLSSPSAGTAVTTFLASGGGAHDFNRVPAVPLPVSQKQKALVATWSLLGNLLLPKRKQIPLTVGSSSRRVEWFHQFRKINRRLLGAERFRNRHYYIRFII